MSYRISFGFEKRPLLDGDTVQRVTFDFDRDYDEPLLVHQDVGRGPNGAHALARLRLHDTIVDALVMRLRALPANYTGVHIRHTDYNSKYVEWLHEARDKVEGPVFVATDNRQCLADCREAFGADRIHSFATLPEQAGEPIHWRTDREGAYERNSDAILDLMTLVLADRYFYVELVDNIVGARRSGFSALAARLRERNELVKRLIGRKFVEVQDDIDEASEEFH